MRGEEQLPPLGPGCGSGPHKWDCKGQGTPRDYLRSIKKAWHEFCMLRTQKVESKWVSSTPVWKPECQVLRLHGPCIVHSIKPKVEAQWDLKKQRCACKTWVCELVTLLATTNLCQSAETLERTGRYWGKQTLFPERSQGVCVRITVQICRRATIPAGCHKSP